MGRPLLFYWNQKSIHFISEDLTIECNEILFRAWMTLHFTRYLRGKPRRAAGGNIPIRDFRAKPEITYQTSRRRAVGPKGKGTSGIVRLRRTIPYPSGERDAASRNAQFAIATKSVGSDLPTKQGFDL